MNGKKVHGVRYPTKKVMKKWKNKEKKGNQSIIQGKVIVKVFYYALSQNLSRVYPRSEEIGERKDKRKNEPNCLVIWVFCYHHKSRIKLIESSRKVYFFTFIRKGNKNENENLRHFSSHLILI